MMRIHPGENQIKYEMQAVVSYYVQLNGLQACERYLFDCYLRRGMAILDMGVGGGRTTAYLSGGGGRYVGADYSEAMVAACAKRFPGLDFRLCDATEMEQFADAEFDAAVFSFNGIDYIPTSEGRARCLSGIARVLKPGGIFIFSSHNARQIGNWPQLADARPHQFVWRILRSLFKSASVAGSRLASGAFFRGQGYIHDPVHGGVDTYVSTPSTIRPQLAAVGFELIETVGAHYPAVRSDFLTPWHYYACRKLVRL